MKTLLSFTLFIALFSLTTASLSFAQGTAESSNATTATSEDPNEAMVPQGAGVPNYGCDGSSRACRAHLVDVRLDANTNPAAKSSGGSSPGSGSSVEGTR